mgnify:FL=1
MTFDPVCVYIDDLVEDSLIGININFQKQHAYPVLVRENHLVAMFTHEKLESIKEDKRKVGSVMGEYELVALNPDLSIREPVYWLN